MLFGFGVGCCTPFTPLVHPKVHLIGTSIVLGFLLSMLHPLNKGAHFFFGGGIRIGFD